MATIAEPIAMKKLIPIFKSGNRYTKLFIKQSYKNLNR